MNKENNKTFIENYVSWFNRIANKWSVETEYNEETCTLTFTPKGLVTNEDVFFEVYVGLDKETDEIPEYIEEQVNDIYEDYDVSYETYIWLDGTGHGKNGAPYELEHVLAGKKEIESALSELTEIVQWYYDYVDDEKSM